MATKLNIFSLTLIFLFSFFFQFVRRNYAEDLAELHKDIKLKAKAEKTAANEKVWKKQINDFAFSFKI